jgi:hypothetical protein
MWYQSALGELEVFVSDDNGASWKLVHRERSSYYDWEEQQVRLAETIVLSDSVRIRVRVRDELGGSVVEALVDDVRIFDVESSVASTLTGFALGVNRPNPFAKRTLIPYVVPAPGSEVRMRLYGVDGRLVRTLLQQHVEPGTHSVSWDGRDDKGLRVTTGIYLLQMQTSQGNLTHKVFYLR